MPDHPPQPNADQREGVTRKQLLVGALVVFLPILVLAIAGAIVGYTIPRMEIERQNTTPPPEQFGQPAPPEAPAPPPEVPKDNADTTPDDDGADDTDEDTDQEKPDAPPEPPIGDAAP